MRSCDMSYYREHDRASSPSDGQVDAETTTRTSRFWPLVRLRSGSRNKASLRIGRLAQCRRDDLDLMQQSFRRMA